MGWTHRQANGAAQVFDALNRLGIDWMVLRNHQGLPEQNRSKDIDLGLRKPEFDRAQNAIAAAALRAGFDRVLVERFQYVRCLTFFGVFNDGAASLKIDLLDGFAFRGAQVFAFDDLWAKARNEQGFHIPHPTDDAVMLWMKPLLTGGIAKRQYRGDISSAIATDPKGFRATLTRTLGMEMSARVWPLLKTGAIPETIPLKNKLRRAAWAIAFRRAPVQTSRNTVQHYLAELNRRRCRNPATFLSVAGPDGVGKTTFVTALSSALAEIQVRDAASSRIAHFRPRILPNIRTLLTGKPDSIADTHTPHSAPPVGRASSTLRLGYYWLDFVAGYWLWLRRHAARGGVVIFDRYFYDFLVDPRRSRLTLPPLVSRMFLAATPKPDFVIVLDADAAVVRARKQELSTAEIERQRRAYRALAANDPDRFIIIPADQPKCELISSAINQLLMRAYQKINSPENEGST